MCLLRPDWQTVEGHFNFDSRKAEVLGVNNVPRPPPPHSQRMRVLMRSCRLEPIPADIEWGGGYTLHRSPAYHRADIQTLTFTSIGSLESPGNLTPICMLENQENIQTPHRQTLYLFIDCIKMDNTCHPSLHTVYVSNQEASCCETVLRHPP